MWPDGHREEIQWRDNPQEIHHGNFHARIYARGTEPHRAFNTLIEKVKAGMKQPFVFDGRNIFKPEKMKSLGFKYSSIGRL